MTEHEIASLLKESLPSAEQTELAGNRVLQRLRQSSSEEQVLDDEPIKAPRNVRRHLLIAVAAAAMVLFVVSAVLIDPPSDEILAVVEGTNGNQIKSGQVVRSNATSVVLVLAEGSRIEMRLNSELQLETVSDGLRVRLNNGSVIVTAAKRQTGHLYVQTKDLMVSVVGTVFLVTTQQAGSRVAVIAGEVRVQHDMTFRNLLPGEQVTTNPSMPSVPLTDEIQWSHNAISHLALLQQAIGVPAPDLSHLSQTAPPPKPSFEVVSVKPNSFGVRNRNSSISGAGGRFVATNVTLRVLMKYAYRTRTRDLLDSQLIGGPAWMDTDRFDVAAKPEGDSRSIPLEEMQRLVQSLLQDRFQLKSHRETRELPVYDLIVVNSEKLKLSEDQSPVILGTGPLPSSASAPPPRGAARLTVGSAGGILTGNGIGMGRLADSLQTQVDRPIIDKTNLPGLYDISLRFAPESDPLSGGPVTATPPGIPTTSSDPAAPPLFSAIQDQLGVKLQPGTGTVEVIVIDTVQKPSEN